MSTAQIPINTDKIGIDIGTLFIKLVFVDKDGKVLQAYHLPHGGEPVAHLKEMLDGVHIPISITGSNIEFIEKKARKNLIQATISGVLEYLPHTRNIIDIGGNSSTLIELDENGIFRNFSQNAQCAAGTGAFLDEQMERLGISYDELKVLQVVDNPPTIASRCAVFAKTDLIHRQQEGYTKTEVWEGLCRSMLQTCLNSLLRGKKLIGPTALVGGASLNKKLVAWLKKEYPNQIEVLEDGHVISAIGATLMSRDHAPEGAWNRNIHNVIIDNVAEQEANVKRKPLRLEKSKYPDFSAHRVYEFEGTDVRELLPLEKESHDIYLGIDIGSTSTKLIAVDANKKILFDIYRKTSGDPIGAVKKLFLTVCHIQESNNVVFRILGAGTTGSGRELIGKLIKADLILNEISAHALGAMDINPDISTVFEIGGQDSKYMRLRKGILVDSNMNYVCAAGTGSFIEEQARKLEYSVKEIGDEVMGVEPPITSDRCTVFMEQDIRKMLKKGYSRIEVLGATMYSIVQNYLAKVVGNRKVDSDKVLFLGATARNKGLVAAFEQLLGVEVIVPSFCHVMGAYGVCLKLIEMMAAKPYESRFEGLKFIEEEFKMEEEVCRLCQNYCRITSVSSANMEDISWGYMCGREPGEQKKKKIPELEMFELRDKMLLSYRKPIDPHRQTVGVPMALITYSFLPLWATFFDKLGFNTVFSRKTDVEIATRGSSSAAADFCYPVKISLGHIAELLESSKTDYVIVPSIMEFSQNEATTRNWFCPCVINQDAYTRGAFKDHKDYDKLFYAPLNLNWSEELLENIFAEKINDKLGVDKKMVVAAFKDALAVQKDFDNKCQEAGRRFLNALINEERTSIVFIGRPYNIHDYGVNFMLPQKVASYGYPVIPLDFIPFDAKTREELREGYHNLYWHYGQQIINAVEYIRQYDNLYPIYVTNFNCGVDSYVLSYAEKAMGNKTMLELEFDEHSSPTGYITRLEAFFDTLHGNPKQVAKKYQPNMEIVPLEMLDKNEEILAPYNADHLPSIYASVLQKYGFKIKLVKASEGVYNLGLKYCRGSECCPAILATGVLVNALQHSTADHINIGMMSSYGPCRVGQYAHMMNNVFKKFPDKKIRFINADISVNAPDSLSLDLKMEVFKGSVAVDVLKRMLYKTRPYEKQPGQTNLAYERHREKLLSALRNGEPLDPILIDATEEFKNIDVDRSKKRLLVGVVGEFYVRCDDFINQDLFKTIEENGGEAWGVNTTEWLIWGTSRTIPEYGEYFWKDSEHTDPKMILAAIEHEQDRMLDLCGEFLADRKEPHMSEVYAAAKEYIDVTCPNECLPAVGRCILFAKKDHVDLVVNVKPFSCMPGNVFEAILNRVKLDFNLPVISIAYEGSGDPNAPVRTMLQNLKRRGQE